MRILEVLQSFFFLFLITCFVGCGPAANNERNIPDKLREQAIEELEKTMREQSGWIKVHAAEYKIQLGYENGVKEAFLEEKEKSGNESPYRIGIWRVLAQASQGEDRDGYINKILGAIRDRDGADRIHAAETLAKLGVPVLDLAERETNDILSGEKNSLYVYTFWASLHSLQFQNTFHANPLLDFIVHHREDQLPLMQAAYALRHYGGLSDAEWGQLADIALNEPRGSLARVYLLSAAYLQASPEKAGTATYAEIRDRLFDMRFSPNKGERMEMAIAIGQKGNLDGLSVLESLLNDENPILEGNDDEETLKQNPSNADVRATAAYSILKMDKRQEYQLAWGDWLVVVLYLLGMLGIGYFYSNKNKSEKDYLLGGGKMNPVAVGLSLFATLLSSLSYLSYPGEIVKYGPVVFSGILVFPLIHYVVGWFLIPKFMKLKVTSAYEILEIKLGISVRMLATFFFLSLRFLWMGTIIFVTVNTAVLSIFDIDASYTLLISAVLMAVTIIYTVMGGLKAVVVTDVIQSVILIGGAFITIVIVSRHFGSFTSWIPVQWPEYWGELKFGLNARERLTIGNALLMTFIWYIASSGSDQMSIQRFLATEDVRAARKTFGVSLITTFIAQSLLGLVGLAVLAYFVDNPHLFSEGESVSSDADALFPKFILLGLPVGLSGLITAGILAAAMSSLSSGLNSTSSVISEDLLKRFRTSYQKPENEVRRIRNLSLFVGIFTLVLSIFISEVEGNLYDVIVKVVNLFVSPLFVLFFMALFVPFATARGVLIGGISSVAVAVAVAFYKFMGIEVLFIMPTSLIFGILTGYVASYFDHKVLGNPETVEKRSRNTEN